MNELQRQIWHLKKILYNSKYFLSTMDCQQKTIQPLKNVKPTKARWMSVICSKEKKCRILMKVMKYSYCDNIQIAHCERIKRKKRRKTPSPLVVMQLNLLADITEFFIYHEWTPSSLDWAIRKDFFLQKKNLLQIDSNSIKAYIEYFSKSKWLWAIILYGSTICFRVRIKWFWRDIRYPENMLAILFLFLKGTLF